MWYLENVDRHERALLDHDFKCPLHQNASYNIILEDVYIFKIIWVLIEITNS